MAFSIVSAAAMLSAGVEANHPLPCEPVADVGGVTFTYQPADDEHRDAGLGLRRRLRHRVREHVRTLTRSSSPARNGPSASARTGRCG